MLLSLFRKSAPTNLNKPTGCLSQLKQKSVIALHSSDSVGTNASAVGYLIMRLLKYLIILKKCFFCVIFKESHLQLKLTALLKYKYRPVSLIVKDIAIDADGLGF